MKEKLIKLLANAYAPYSNYPVSCIVITKDNNEFIGVNVENANGTSICAERNAIHNAIANGYKKNDFKELHLMTRKVSVPCFACRQVFTEFFSDDLKIFVYDLNNQEKEYTVLELCPHKFTEDDLR